MELKRALEILEYNKAMLTCDMSIGRDPEHQDVSPDYYGEDAENLYYAIVCVEKYIKNAIPIEWIKKKSLEFLTNRNFRYATDFQEVIDMWKVENNIPLFDGELKITWEKENERV